MKLLRAELQKLARRLAIWILLLVPIVWIGVLGYGVLYLVVRFPPKNANFGGVRAELLRQQLYPEHFVQVALGNPEIGAALAILLGVLAFGGEYGWNTWKLLFTQGHARLAVFAAKVAALLITVVGVVVVVFASAAAMSVVIALIDGVKLTWPDASTIARAMASSYLALVTWAMFGVALATLFRQTALAIGLGLVYAVVFEGLLAALLSGLAPSLRDYLRPLPGANASALFGTFGGLRGVPISHPLVSAAQAGGVLAAYAVLFAAVAATLIRARDVT